ncbi:MAG: hypothetical protein ACKPKO_16260, partial [Candidatus Fonsibacter sp.]
PVIICLWYRDLHTDPAKRPFQLGRVATDILLHSDELKVELRDLVNAEYVKKKIVFLSSMPNTIQMLCGDVRMI